MLLRELRHADHLRAAALAAYGQYPPCAVFGPHRAAAALSHRDRGIAGMGLHRRAAGAPEGLSRRGLAALEKEEARGTGRNGVGQDEIGSGRDDGPSRAPDASGLRAASRCLVYFAWGCFRY